MPLFSSTLPLRAALALTQAGGRGLTLREVARAIGVTDSSAQHAVGTLVDEDAASVLDAPRPRYVLGASEVARHLPRFALRYLPLPVALGSLAGANRAVEFASYASGDQTLYAAYAEDADPADELLFTSALAEMELDLVDAGALRDELRPAVEAQEVALYGRA